MIARRYHILFTIALLGLHCSVLQVQHVLKSTSNDWTMYGGDVGRTNSTITEARPPFSAAWQYDASAGFSLYSAAVADSHLIVGNLQGEVHIVDIATGRGKGNHDFGSAVVGTPIVIGEMLYVTLAHDEASLVAYNLFQGKIEWAANLGDIESSPLVIDTQLIVTSVHGTLYNINRQNGVIRWKYSMPHSSGVAMIHTSPVTDGNVVIFGADDGKLYAVDIREGKLQWTASTDAAILATPSVANGKVMVGSTDTRFYAFDMMRGTLLWKQQLDAKIYAPQAVDHHRIFVGTSGRTFYCLSEEDGTILWKDTTDGVISSAPVATEEFVYVGSLGKSVYAFRTANGESVWKYAASGRIKSAPILWKSYLFILVEDHDVVALKSETGA